MSYIGKNIRKIRSVKNYSQTDFANKFNLKRATVGAYEEGRSEPKISTLIDIANYFSIDVDDLLKKELTVNDLFKFDIFKKELQKSAKHNLKPSQAALQLVEIPFVTATQNKAWAVSAVNLANLPMLKLPLPAGDEYVGVEIADKAMEQNGNGIAMGDVIIGRKPKATIELENERTYLIETADGFTVRKVERTKSGLTLKTTNTDFYSQQVSPAQILNFWQIAFKLSSFLSHG